MPNKDMQRLAELSSKIDDEFKEHRPLRPEFRRLTRDTGLVIRRDLRSGLDAFMLVVEEIHLKHVHGEPLNTAHLEILNKMKDSFQDAKANAGVCKTKFGLLQSKIVSSSNAASWIRSSLLDIPWKTRLKLPRKDGRSSPPPKVVDNRSEDERQFDDLRKRVEDIERRRQEEASGQQEDDGQQESGDQEEDDDAGDDRGSDVVFEDDEQWKEKKGRGWEDYQRNRIAARKAARKAEEENDAAAEIAGDIDERCEELGRRTSTLAIEVNRLEGPTDRLWKGLQEPVLTVAWFGNSLTKHPPSPTYDKTAFAMDILDLCQQLLFDWIVRADVEQVLRNLSSVWEKNGWLPMPPSLKEKFDKVQGMANSIDEETGSKMDRDFLFDEDNLPLEDDQDPIEEPSKPPTNADGSTSDEKPADDGNVNEGDEDAGDIGSLF